MTVRPGKSIAISLSLAIGSVLISCSEASTPQPPELATWELGEPSLVVGALDDGPAAFSPIRYVTVGPRSELYVLLPQEHEVRVFGDDGEFLGSMGAEGEGPGEFSRPTDLGFVGDTLWVLDTGARRVSYFHEGDFLRVQSFPPLEDLHPERFSRVAGVVAGPRLVVSTDVMTVFQPNVTTSPGLLMTYMGGTTWISRERIPGHPRLWQVVSEEGVNLAQVRAPIGFELRSVGWQAVWGLVLDELDVPYLVKRPILRKSVRSPSNQGGGR